MDAVAHEVVLFEEQGRMVFYGKMAGSVAQTRGVGGVRARLPVVGRFRR